VNIQAVREKISSKLSEVSEITPGIFRGTRRQGEQDFAAYVFDLNSKLPSTVGNLSSYLDDVLGRTYFSDVTSADLRWNNYLYFVVKGEVALDPSFNTTKRILEADKDYARKFVVFEDDLERVLNELDSIAVVTGASSSTDVLQTWSTMLNSNGLDDVLDDSRTIVDIVRSVSTGTAKRSVRSRKISGVQDSKQLISSHLKSISLGGFRPYPKEREFGKLGRANLLFGPNGAGKTSFMEGLEFLFCGANRRSSAPLLSIVKGCLESGMEVSTSNVQDLSDFKTRQRLWYGSDDSGRSNNLPNQFSRFNFLNTDAAAELSLFKETSKPGQKNNSDTLADLLSGHEATEIWRRILALQKSISGEERDKRVLRDQANVEKTTKEENLKKLEAAPGQADAAYSIFVKDLQRIDWSAIPSEKQAVTSDLVDTLSELASQLGMVRQLSWMDASITESSIVEKEKEFTPVLISVRDELSNIDTNEQKVSSIAQRLSVVEARKKGLAAIQPDAVEDLLFLTKNVKDANDELARDAKLSSALPKLPPPESWESKYGIKTVKDANVECVNAGIKLDGEVSEIQQRLSVVTSTHTQLQNAMTQLNEWALKVIEHRHSDKNCPVCNTEFGPGELLRHMGQLASVPSEVASAELSRELDRLKSEQIVIVKGKQWLAQLSEFVVTAQDDPSKMCVSEAKQKAENTEIRLHELLETKKASQQRIDGYTRSGLTLTEVERLCSPFDGQSKEVTSVVNIGEAKLRVERFLQTLLKEKSEIDKENDARKNEAKHLLARLSVDSEQTLASASEVVATRLGHLQRVAAACNVVRSHLNIQLGTDLVALQDSLEAAVLGAKNVLSLTEQDANSDTEKNTVKIRLNELNSKLENHKAALERLASAQKTLTEIIEKHSLEDATAAIVQAAHKVADSIFSRIHSPSEYQVTSNSQSPLSRRNDESAVQLNEVSTGQRAAYALSMFLALNAQVKDGPKVILLDDPISHIDDLNALSFLDYLRNLVLKSDRQLFFATADEKVAGLFAHKFGFLGDDFQIIELSRS
jgi:exonuclease SbcC